MKKMIAATIFLSFTAFGALAQASSSDDLARRMIERRGVEAMIWGMPAVNADLMLQEALSKTTAKPNDVVFWSRPADWKNQTLTPNPDAIYFMSFWNVKDGPIVIDIPPAVGGSIAGNIVNVWQMPLEDAGPEGADKGKGGKYLILPPGYTGKVPKGYIALPSDTFSGFALMRSNLKSHSDEDIAKSVAYGKQIKVYPLAKAASPPPTNFVDASGTLFDTTIKYDASFYRNLDRIVQSEPWLPRDRAMIDQLKTIGIEKGKPYNPDAKTEEALNAAAREAHAWLSDQYDQGFPVMNAGIRWFPAARADFAKSVQNGYADNDIYMVDVRGVSYTLGFTGIKRLGTAQFYLLTSKDKDGNPFDGAGTYRLTVPPNAPVKQYWSATVYDRDTHALVRNMHRASVASISAGVEKNPDGSVDVYFGPKAPAGKEANWVPTDPNREFELMFRLYGPEKPLFDKSWKLPDVEKVAAAASTGGAGGASPVATVPVTADNFARAESDLYFSNLVKQGGLGKLSHRREPASIDHQDVVRLNRDTLYTSAVFDLDAGPVTISLPDPGTRFLSLQIIDEDQYTHSVSYGAGEHTLSKDQIGTRYVVAGIRILVDPNDAKDVAAVHALQDAIKVSQPGGPGSFEVPNWDPVSQKKVRDALRALASTLPDTKHMFGRKEDVDPVRRLLGSASAWGGNPETEALYLNVVPAKNDGNTIYRLAVRDVPVDAFWSISLYNAQGYYQKNDLNAYNINNITAAKDSDGSVVVQFGGCDGKVPNCLPVMPGWNYMVRLYRPRAEVLDGTWKFPTAKEM
ncbi:DUF1214 domain-containing protein [Starkeya sp. ORNL1]|uniref:DUF1214 domain-containing protein n=1 Tax=Starkeya sp. ORNL1 TaxID=2709380 RepID=UPI0032B2DD7B